MKFNNRVFGAVILKSINSNFNADFTTHPRTLPDGTVYSTDKALKYAIKDYFRKHLKEEKLLYVKRYKSDTMNPMTLNDAYANLFDDDGKDRFKVLKNLLSCIDVRLFGATFAASTNISIHGPLQINHGVNKYPENEIYTEDILSPFATEKEKEAQMSTIGNQTNLKEGHYVFHFSLNPQNTDEYYEIVKQQTGEELYLSDEDIAKLKEAFNSAVTALDSTRKIGTENELTFWVQLKDGSRKVLPSFTELIEINRERVIDFTKVSKVIHNIEDEVESVEIYYEPEATTVAGLEINNLKRFNILTNKEF